ncbi:MAG TPA: extracellular solute-binding protein [Candidatus Limivivens intestinipullorum]|uniref:Extracellular solute-binding protein n=1 Tax=Candidatus Limivivens intestinipullorum TaxID=2840858 RepID=A0A9D1JIC2_9FIRM|nr:extracellular solute-binding protein [Candidatus Limivivens intestinipullorum]
MKKRSLAVLLTAAMVLGMGAGAITANAEGEREEVRVLIKWSESQISNWPELVDAYNADDSNPVTINLEFYGTEGYDDKVKAELMGDNPAGIVQLMKTTFNDYAANGQLEELSGFIEEQGWDYNEGALAWAGPLDNEDGGVYGIPDFANTSCIFYNTKLFEELGLEVPTDIESLKEVSAALNENGYKAIVTGATTSCAADLLAKVQAQMIGSDFLLQCYNNEAKYNDPQMVEALEIVNDLVQCGVIDASSADYSDDDAISEFVMGNAAMYSAHTGYASSIDSLKDEDFSYDIIETMNFVDNPKTSVAVTWGSMWCIPSNVQNKEAAQEALAFLFGEDVQRNDVEVLGKIVNVDAWNEGLTHPALLTAAKQLEGAGNADSFYLLDMVSAKVLDNMSKGIQEMIQGSKTPQEVMDNVQMTWEEENAQK